MKKILSSNIYFLIGLFLTLSLFWPLFAAPYFSHHDDVQIIRVFEMDKCIKDYQIPCRLVPDLGGLYGYPIFNFYAPLPYYFGELIYLITHSLLVSAKVMFAVSFLGAYLFMYLLASKLWGKIGGSMAAIFYSFAPYHALDFYVRGAMGELWGLMLFPAIFWSLIRLEEKINIPRLLTFSVFTGALIVSHNLSALIFLPFVLIWVAILFFKKRDMKFLWIFLGGMVLAVALASFYLFPALFEKNLVHLETTIEGYFSYTEHFKGFKKLFLERSWGYGASIREVPGGEKDGLSYQIGWVHLVGWFLSLLATKLLWRKNRTLSIVIVFCSLAFFISVFMINPRSEFIWRAIDPLKYLQFPWRFLMLTIFFVSLISGSIFKVDFKHKKLLWISLTLAVVVLNFTYFSPEKFINTNDQERLSGKEWDKQIKRSIFDYLPIYAKEPPAELATAKYQILTGESRIFDFQEGTNWINFKTETRSHSIIRLSQYYFPNWRIFVDGKETKFEYKNNSLGLMTIILGKGFHEITARFYDTPIRIISNIVTLIGFVLSAVLLLISSKKVRRSLSYYRKRMN